LAFTSAQPADGWSRGPQAGGGIKAALAATESDMLMTGGLLVSIALLTLAAAAPVFRRSDPPRWTRRRWVGELVTLTIVCTFAVGLSCLGAGAIAALETGLDYLDLALLALVVLVAVAIWRSMKARAQTGAAHGDRPMAVAEGAAASARQPASPHGAA
jgi:hypothetical protein